MEFEMEDPTDSGDFVAPAEVPIVESKVLQIPSGLPSLETFIRAELEKEKANATVELADSTSESDSDIGDSVIDFEDEEDADKPEAKEETSGKLPETPEAPEIPETPVAQSTMFTNFEEQF